MKRSLLIAALALSACGKGSAGNAADAAANAAAPAPAPKAEAYSGEEETDLLSWSLAYPAEAAAIPALAEAIRASSLKDKAENLAAAKADKAERAAGGFPFNAYEQSDKYSVAGVTERLLSLTDEWFTYTGGAHPSHGTIAWLWDKAAGRRITSGDLLAGGAIKISDLYRDAFCKALNKERKERREGEDAAVDPNDPFNQCPKFDELKIIPKGPETGGPMTALLFHADPYVAGPYVEGDYDIELPVTAALIAALKPEYRSSFAAKP